VNLKGIWQLIRQSVSAWVDDYAPSMGAALAYYTIFSIAPLLIIVIAVAGFAFGREAVQGRARLATERAPGAGRARSDSRD
jgi:membrane protein